MRLLVYLMLALGLAFGGNGTLAVDERVRVQPFKGANEWREVHLNDQLEPAATAIVICDMWDKHWCSGATKRVAEMAPRMDHVLTKARSAGIAVIHAPSETMAFYETSPQRKRILAFPAVRPPTALPLTDPPLPIDDKSGGCDTHESFYKAWTRETPLLHIDENDVISDNGREIYSFLRAKNITTLLVMGVHANMCILNRSFAIRQMSRWGLRCILVRDLTDAMYDPQDAPRVKHAQGTELVIEHIEKYWAPSILSTDLLRAINH